MRVDLTQVIIAVIRLVFSLAVTALSVYIVPPVKKWLEARTTLKQHELITDVVRQTVLAAEQTIVGSCRGSERLAYVTAKLKEKGFDVDIDMIEAAVRDMKDGAMNFMVDD